MLKITFLDILITINWIVFLLIFSTKCITPELGNRIVYFGSNDYNNLGYDTTVSSYYRDISPARHSISDYTLIENGNRIKFICTTYQNTMMLTENGDVFGIGSNTHGLVNSDIIRNLIVPFKMEAPSNLNKNEKFINFKCKRFSLYLYTNQNRVFRVGLNYLDYYEKFTTPVLLVKNQRLFKPSNEMLLMVNDSKKVYTAGENNFLKLGDNLFDNITRVEFDLIYMDDILSENKMIREIYNYRQVCFVVLEGEIVYGWGGDNTNRKLGELYNNGRPFRLDFFYSVQSDFKDGDFIDDIKCGQSMACFMISKNQSDNSTKVLSWGGDIDSYYRGRSGSYIYPKLVNQGERDSNDKIVAISVSSSVAYFLTSWGKVYGIGHQIFNSLEEASGTYISSPKRLIKNETYKNISFMANSEFKFFAGLYKDLICNDKYYDNPTVCSGHGKCLHDIGCECEPLYTGPDCAHFFCFNESSYDGKPCNGNGFCKRTDECLCYSTHGGFECEIHKCFSILSNLTNVCSSHGNCTSPNECVCESEYIGKNCGEIKKTTAEFLRENLVFFIVPVIFILILLFCFCVLAIFGLCSISKRSKRIQKFKELEDFEIYLEEQKVKEKKNVNMEINKKLYDITILQSISTGSTGSSIYKGKWKDDIIVAIKLFKKDLFSERYELTAFEKEVGIYSVLKSPDLLHFYGVSVKLPSIAIVLEFCENEDLFSFLNINNFSMDERKKKMDKNIKNNIILSIARGISFLHEKQIIHRNLTSENILLNSKLESKIKGFGLSKYLGKEKETTLTVFRNKNYYQSPELILGKKYDYTTDIFSYSIILFEIITERPAFGENPPANIEFLIANNPNARPKCSVEEFGEFEVLIDIMKKLWNDDPKKRISFSEIMDFCKQKLMNNQIEIKVEKEEEEEKSKENEDEPNINWSFEKLAKEIEEMKRKIKDLKD